MVIHFLFFAFDFFHSLTFLIIRDLRYVKGHLPIAHWMNSTRWKILAVPGQNLFRRASPQMIVIIVLQDRHSRHGSLKAVQDGWVGLLVDV